MKRIFVVGFLSVTMMVSLWSCAKKDEAMDKVKPVAEQNQQENEAFETEEDRKTEDKPKILSFVDVFGEEYQTEINPTVPENTYSADCFIKNEYMEYKDDRFTSRVGVDVSHHQGYIDWDAVKEEGVDFAFLRIGYRGYGKEGTINADREFDRNIVNAQEAGLDVGVYFFSQAINEAEAREEAEFVIEKLKGHHLELPVVYDPESILDDEARTDDISGEQFTKNTMVFCEMVSDAGYEPAIYSNMMWEAFKFDLSRLTGYPIWYADYEPKPQTPYDFRFWQYTNEGSIKGIDGITDVNIEIIPKS